MNRYSTTIILLIIFVGLGLYYFLFEQKRPDLQTRKENSQQFSILSFDQDKVTFLSLIYPDKTITLEKTGDNWKITKPQESDIDNTKFNQYINSLESLKSTTKISDISKNDAGLDNPQLSINIKSDNKEYQLIIGKEDFSGSNVYVKNVNDDFVALVDKTSIDEFKKQEEDFK